MTRLKPQDFTYLQPTGRPWYSIANASSSEATVLIYDVIGATWDEQGVTAKAFVRELANLKVSKIHLRINSPGGSIFDALAIRQALDEHPATIETHIDGVAASAAAWIGLGAESVVMAPKSRIFIHDAMSFVLGNEKDMREEAAVLDGLSNDIADMLAMKAGNTRAHWRRRMQLEEWFSDQQAVDAGLADGIAGAVVTNLAVDVRVMNLFRAPADVRDRCVGPDCGCPSEDTERAALQELANSLKAMNREMDDAAAKRAARPAAPAAFSLPALDRTRLKVVAQNQRTRIGESGILQRRNAVQLGRRLGQEYNHDVLAMARARGINVVVGDVAQDRGVSATYDPPRPGRPALITVLEDVEPERTAINIAHELGHAVLNHQGAIKRKQTQAWDMTEREAEAFGHAFLGLIT